MADAVESASKPKKRVGNPNPRTDHLEKYKFPPGKSGNPAGRQPGSKTRLAEKMIQELERFFDKNGRSLIQKVYEEQPATLLQSLIRILPKDFSLSVNGGVTVDISLDQRKRIAESWLCAEESTVIESDVVEKVLPAGLPPPADDEPEIVPARALAKPARQKRKRDDDWDD